jgi:hypothetical protein
MAEGPSPFDSEFQLESLSIDWGSILLCQGSLQQDFSRLSANNGTSSGHSTTVPFLQMQPEHPLVSIVPSNKIFRLTCYSVRLITINQRAIPF